MRGGRQEVPVVAVDFGEAVFGGGCQVTGNERAPDERRPNKVSAIAA